MIDEAITERILALRGESKNCNARWFCDKRVPLILDTLQALLDDFQVHPQFVTTTEQVIARSAAVAAFERFTAGPVLR